MPMPPTPSTRSTRYLPARRSPSLMGLEPETVIVLTNTTAGKRGRVAEGPGRMLRVGAIGGTLGGRGRSHAGPARASGDGWGGGRRGGRVAYARHGREPAARGGGGGCH